MNMTEASKAGVTDLTQMKEMAKLINASISVASENNPQKNIKTAFDAISALVTARRWCWI